MLENHTIKYLNEFIILAETGHYPKAAEQLYLSKSALTKHIRDLENSVEHKLLEQSGHRLVLTDFGNFFLDYAKSFVSLDRDYENAIKQFEQGYAQEIRIAISAFMNCDHIINTLWSCFTNDFPQYHLSTMEQQTDNYSLEDLFAMGYELVFALSPSPKSQTYNCYSWAKSTIVALLPLSHPLTRKNQISLKELSEESFILTPKSTSLYQYILSLCHEAGFEPQVDFTIDGNANLIELVSGIHGVALTTYNNVYRSRKHNSVAIVRLNPEPSIYLNLYSRKDRPLSAAAGRFFEYAKMMQKEHDDIIPYYGPEVEY